MGSIAGAGGSLFLRKGLVTAQVALSFLLLFGAGLFVRSLQNLKTTDTGVALDNLVTFQLSPALSGYDDPRATHVLPAAARSAARRSPGVKSAALAAVPILAGDEWDSSMAVEGHQAAGRRGHAGVHERAVARLLRDDEDSDARGARLQARRDAQGRREGRDRQPAVRRALLPGQERRRQAPRLGGGPKAKLTIEIIGVVADSLYEGPREGVRRQVFVPNWGKNSAVVLRAHADRVVGARTALVRNEVKQLDAAMPVYAMKTVEAQLDETLLTDRLDRDAVGGLRPARDAARVDRSLRRDGVRRRAAQEGARHPPRARRAARRS